MRRRSHLSIEQLECRRPLAGDLAGPGIPTLLAASAISPAEIGLSWSLADAADTGVVIERRVAGTAEFVTLAVLPAGEVIYTDTSCWADRSYTYRVKARGAAGDSGFSAEVTASSLPIGAGCYALVAGLTAAPTSPTTATVSFTDTNGDGVSYIVERSAAGAAYQIVASLGTTTVWRDTGLTPGAEYAYRVRGTGWTRGTSDYSAPVGVVMPARPAAAPIEPVAVTADAPSATSVRLSWTPQDPSPAAYVIERSIDFDPWHPITWRRIAITATGATSFLDAGLTPETPYVYRVRATRGGVESDCGRPAADVMQVLFGDGVGVVTASAGTGIPKTYDIGPGRPLSRLADLDWSLLGPGDTVNIHAKPGGYHELLQIASRGTAAAWITVNGVPDPVTGALPVIDGRDAILAPQFRNHWSGLHGYGAIVVGTRPGYAAGYKPGYIAIRGLEVRNCSSGETFIDVDGTRRGYGNVGAGIYLERCDHVTISGCSIHDNGEGIFGAGQATFDRVMTDITVESNRIFANGNVGSEREHNTYIEAVGTVYQFNRYGPLRPGALGAGLKDRSAGTVIRSNWIEGGFHQLQLPEAQNQADLALALPRYRTTIVQGNTLVAPPGNGASLIWFGGDQGLSPWYRKGVLYVHSNTFIARSDQSQNYKSMAIQASTGAEALDVRDNILAAIPDTPGAAHAAWGLVGADNNVAFGRNWVTPGWHMTTSADFTFRGRAAGVVNLIVGASADPGFIDLAGADYRLAGGSVCIDAAGRPAGTLQAYPLATEFRLPAGFTMREVRGAAADLGSFEAGGSPLPLVAPTRLLVTTLSQGRLALSWQDESGNETGFVVERRRAAGDWRPVVTVGANVTRFVDGGLRSNTAYSYRVRAIDTALPEVRISAATPTVTIRTPRSTRWSRPAGRRRA